MTRSELESAYYEAELAARARARTSLVDYAKYIEIPGAPVDETLDCELFDVIPTPLAAHHILLLQALQRISERRHGRLMVLMPPGSAKSIYSSVVFPSWYLGTGKRKLIMVSYGDDLAIKMGRRTRSITKQARYKYLFNAELLPDSKAGHLWALTNQSEYMAAGITSGITGNRADGVLIDDPVRGRQEANSEASSATNWSAYNDDVKTRLKPGGFIVLVQTRWSEKDLGGRLLPKTWKGESGLITCSDGFEWEVICLPAKCELPNDPLGRKIGDYLWPEWFDLKHWSQFESLPMTWASLYQQRPAPLEGGLFKPDRIKVIDEIPPGYITWVRGWDFGASVDGDYSVGFRMGRTMDGSFIIADVARFRLGPAERDARIKALSERDGRLTKISIPQDPGAAGKTQVFYLTTELVGFTVVSSPESGDKTTRAEPAAAQTNVGNISMLRGDWNEPFANELRSFPNGEYDDQVDAFSRTFAELITHRPMVISAEAVKEAQRR